MVWLCCGIWHGKRNSPITTMSFYRRNCLCWIIIIRHIISGVVAAFDPTRFLQFPWSTVVAVKRKLPGTLWNATTQPYVTYVELYPNDTITTAIIPCFRFRFHHHRGQPFWFDRQYGTAYGIISFSAPNTTAIVHRFHFHHHCCQPYRFDRHYSIAYGVTSFFRSRYNSNRNNNNNNNNSSLPLLLPPLLT